MRNRVHMHHNQFPSVAHACPRSHKRELAYCKQPCASRSARNSGITAASHSQAHHIYCSSFEDVHDVMLHRAKELLGKAQGCRVAIGIAGAPGSGKTHAAVKLAQGLNEIATHSNGDTQHDPREIAVVVPMDGFHYYRTELDQMPDPALAHARRGAAFTFNARLFVDCVKRILQGPCGPEAHAPIPVPSFDHGVGDPVEGGFSVQPHHQVILVEGLYVLLEDEPWSELRHLLTEAWMLHVEPRLSLAQVVERQVRIGNTREAAAERVGNNDLINTDEVIARSRQPHLVIETSQAHRAVLTTDEFEYAKFKARQAEQG